MVRTKASNTGVKAVAAKAPRKALGGGGGGGAGPSGFGSPKAGKGSKYEGGNPACARPTPGWQKGIGDFFAKPPESDGKENTEPDGEPETKKSRVEQDDQCCSSSTDQKDSKTDTDNESEEDKNETEDIPNEDDQDDGADNKADSPDNSPMNKSDSPDNSPVKRKPLISESDDDD